MYDWQIVLCLPVGTSKNGKEKIFTNSVTFSHGNTNAYMAVETFKHAAVIEDAFVTREVNVRINLRDIVNLHNCDGIKDISRVKQMKRKIVSGRHILHKDEIPNIKLVRPRQEKLYYSTDITVCLLICQAGKLIWTKYHIFLCQEQTAPSVTKIYWPFLETTRIKSSLMNGKNMLLIGRLPKLISYA